eukprot:403372858
MTKIQFCEICYTNEIDPNKKCANFFPCTCIEQKYCDTCIADWVQQSFKKHQLMKDFKIKCMNSECKKDILFEAFVEYFTFNDSLCELTLINTTAFHHYLSHQEDVRACPSEGCSYRGVINLKACRDNLVCEICNKEWRDISQISNWEHFTMKLKNMTRFNFETLTHLHNLIFEEPCPRCGMLIQKNGGCNHMMCAKCNHEFCWWCLDSYYHYVHGGMRFCPYRYAAVIGSVIMAIFLLNQKLVYIYSTLFAIQWFILYNLGAFVLLKAFLGSFIFYGFFIDEYKRDKSNRVAYGRSYMSKCKIITLSILFVILLSSHLTIIYISVSNNFTWRCLEILYYELMLGLIIGGCYLLFLGGRWGIRYSRFVFKRYILRQANYNFDGTYTFRNGMKFNRGQSFDEYIRLNSRAALNRNLRPCDIEFVTQQWVEKSLKNQQNLRRGRQHISEDQKYEEFEEFLEQMTEQWRANPKAMRTKAQKYWRQGLRRR